MDQNEALPEEFQDLNSQIASLDRFRYKKDKFKDLLPTKKMEVTEPVCCGETPAKCCIKRNGTKSYFTLDVKRPFWLKIPRFYCKVHDKYFFSEKGDVSPAIVVFYKIRMTKRFYYSVSNMYLDLLNFSKVRDMVQSIWKTFVLTNGHLSLSLSNAEASEWYLQKLYVSVTLIRIIVLHFWKNDPAGKEFYEKKRLEIWKDGAEILRGDHTFKIASTLGGYDSVSKSLKRVNGRVYSLVNEKGYVLDLRVVPDGTNAHVAKLLEQFWKYNKNCDDKDEKFIVQTYSQIFGNKKILVGQDRWHMLDRISRALPSAHPDKISCMLELRRIFNLLNPITPASIEAAEKKRKPKPTPESRKRKFLQQIDEWEIKYTSLSFSDCLTFNESVDALGEWMVAPEQAEKPIDENTFEVLRVVGKRERNGSTEYLIQWKGYSVQHNEWIPEDKCDCDAQIKTFEKNSQEKKEPILKRQGLHDKIQKMKNNKGIYVL